MRRFVASAAAIALAAGFATTGTAIGQGNSQGNAKGPDKERSVKANGPDRGSAGPAAKSPGNSKRGNDKGPPPSASRGGGDSARMAAPPARGNGNARGNAGDNAPRDVGREKGPPDRANNGPRMAPQGQGNRTSDVRRSDARNAIRDGGRRFADRDGWRSLASLGDGARGLVNGCPPGLAKKYNGCRPPGLARQQDRDPYRSSDWWGLSRLGDGRFFYDDGYLLRLGPDGGIGGYVPLLGGALSIGNPWPSSYDPVALPPYYESYYGLGSQGSYRYANDVVYRVDPETSAITSIAALLTGDDFRIGSPLPSGYDVYNVPYQYRQNYYDTPDAMYRYSDGYIYEVDPETRLIAAAIEMIAS